MISMKKAAVIAAVTTFFVTSAAYANETYICKHDTQVRQIQVVYESASAKVPCEVTYDKGQGATSLWQAQNQEGYCEEQAAAFVEKQRGWGWDCAQQ